MISFDHWHLGFIGCYGNDWIETPHLDRLATESIVFDRHFSENIDPAASNHAWWTGQLQFPLTEAEQRECPDCYGSLQQQGIDTCLIVESDGHDDSAVAPPFDSLITARGTDGFDVPETETPFARTVQRAVRWLEESAAAVGTGLLWIKSRGIPAPWVPPQDFAGLYLEDFGLASDEAIDQTAGDAADIAADDAESSPVDEPAISRAASADDSLDWRYAAAMYAAYVTLVDRWLGRLLQQIDRTPGWNQALLIVTAGAGQALGEHGRLADEQLPLRAESIHAPLWIRLPDRSHQGTRRQALTQTPDIGPTVLDWLQVPAQPFTPVAPPPPPVTAASADAPSNIAVPWLGHSLLPLIDQTVPELRSEAWMGSGQAEWGIRTADFFFAEQQQRAPDEEDTTVALFEKPSDRWDQFNMASQYPQIIEDLRLRLHSFRESRAAR